MVQKYQSPVRVYKYPFELVMAAYQRRFPVCKLIPVFLGSDILFDQVLENGALHVIERRCRLAFEAPYLLKKLIGLDHITFIQKNTLDRRGRTLSIVARNESFSSRVSIIEHCFYSVHPVNSEWTCFEQDASLDIKSFFGFESTVEKIAMKQYTENIKKGKEVIEYYISELLEEGIVHVPTWTESQDGAHEMGIGDSHGATVKASSTVGSSGLSVVISPSSPVMSRAVSCTSTMNLGASASNIACGDEDGVKKLDADYIQRCLGELTPYEESKLVQLRLWLQDTHKEKIPKDQHILRFLKAREFNIEKAREMLCHSLAWRKLRSIDRLSSTYEPPAAIQKYFPGGWHYHDKDGRPVYILRLGQMDVKGLLKSVSYESILRHVLAVSEEGLNRCEEATKARGYPVTNCTCIIDLEGLSMRHLWRPGIRVLLRIIEVVEANYPETMGLLLIVRAPRIFPVLWTLVSPFIDERTRDKFLLYAGNDYQGQGGLIDYVDPVYIPDFLDGECFCAVPEGGLVPKNLYTSVEEEVDKDRSLVEDISLLCPDANYHTAYVVRDFPHEVLVQVPEKGSVITWDFDILKGDVTFTLLRCRRHASVTSPPHEHHVSGAAGGVGSVQYVDRHWTVGVDLSIVEPPLVCRDGDSIQGSHVASQAGSFILQWKHFDSARGSFDLLSTHKSKVMYYTEILQSDKFRGSMSSLQSSHSGFSQLSANASNSGHSVLTQSSIQSTSTVSSGGSRLTQSSAPSR